MVGWAPFWIFGAARSAPFSPPLVALAAPTEAGTHVLIARGPDADVHCGNLLKAVAKAAGGGGGGRPDHAQGRLPAGVDFEALLRAQL